MFTGISVACDVSKGTFMSEYFIKIKPLDKNTWEGAVDKEMVIDLQSDPKEESYVKGRVYAYLISYDSETAVIEMPVEDSTAGRRILVSVQDVRKEKVPA